MKTDLDLIRSGEVRAAVLDIESTGLKADWGYTICASLKEVNPDNMSGRIQTFVANPKDFTDETLMKDLTKAMDSYDLILTWYGSMFDHKFINARCAKHRLPYPARERRRDLCFVSKANFAVTSHSLANVARLMFGKTEKTRTDHDIWIAATRRDKKAVDYLVDHCEKDVIETEKVYKRLIPLLGKLRRG